MKSLVIYVWRRLGREESGTQTSWLPEGCPHLVQKGSKGDRSRRPEPLPPRHSPCRATQTAPLQKPHGQLQRLSTQAARLVALMQDAALVSFPPPDVQGVILNGHSPSPVVPHLPQSTVWSAPPRSPPGPHRTPPPGYLESPAAPFSALRLSSCARSVPSGWEA